MLLPKLSQEQFLYMYDLWNEHYAARQFLDEDEAASRYEALVGERELLFETREMFPERYTEMTARLYQIGLELAELQIRT